MSIPDRTGQIWMTTNCTFLVTDAGAPWTPGAMRVEHPALCLHDPKGRWPDGELTTLTELPHSLWEEQSFMRRVA